MKGTSKLPSKPPLLFLPNVRQITTTNDTIKKPVVQKNPAKKAIKSKPSRVQKHQSTKNIVNQEEDGENFDKQFRSALEELDQIKKEYGASSPHRGAISLETKSATTVSDKDGSQLRKAEWIMTKLYKKNMELEQLLKEREENAVASSTAQESSSIPSDPRIDNQSLEQMLTSLMKLSFHPSKTANMINVQSLQGEYLRCLVQEQDEMIQVLRKKRVHQLPVASTSHQNVLHVHERLQEVMEQNVTVKQQAFQMKQDYLKLSSKVKDHHMSDIQINEMIQTMEERLEHEQTERKQERQYYNKKLFDVEKQLAQQYAKNKVNQQRLEKMHQVQQDQEHWNHQVKKAMYHVFEKIWSMEKQQ